MMARSLPLPAATSSFQRCRRPLSMASMCAAHALHLVDPGHALVVVVAQAARLVVDDVLEPGEPVLHREDLVDLLLILDDRELHLGVLQHIGHLFGDRVGIERHRHGAERLAGAHRPIEPRLVAPDDGVVVAALEPQFGEPDREREHLVAHLLPGPGLPDAEVLVPHGRAAAAHGGVADEQLGKGIRVGGRRRAAIRPLRRDARHTCRSSGAIRHGQPLCFRRAAAPRVPGVLAAVLGGGRAYISDSQRNDRGASRTFWGRRGYFAPPRSPSILPGPGPPRSAAPAGSGR